MTDAVTAALRERLARERARRETAADLACLSAELRAAYDTRPVSREEWDAASGEEA